MDIDIFSNHYFKYVNAKHTQLFINVYVSCLSGGHALRVHPELLEGALQLVILIPKLPATAKVKAAVVPSGSLQQR